MIFAEPRFGTAILEEKDLAGLADAHVNSATLRARDIAPAAPDYHTYQSARWADIYDGLVVFAEEHPPHSSRVYPAP